MKKILCPSMMCANYDNLKDEVIKLDNAGVDIFHCDVMDGSFVSNMSMGIKDVECIRRNTEKMVDCHLMIENPGSKIQLFINAGVDLIYIHPESERYVVKTLGEKVANALISGEIDKGILICGTGVGISLSANKVNGIRAVVCSEPYTAALSRSHNNTNILAFGSRVVGIEAAKMIVDSWLTTEYEGGRHQRRLDMITAIENKQKEVAI